MGRGGASSPYHRIPVYETSVAGFIVYRACFSQDSCGLSIGTEKHPPSPNLGYLLESTLPMPAPLALRRDTSEDLGLS